MSYQPEPDRISKRLACAGQIARLARWTEGNPIALIFRGWLYLAVFAATLLLIQGLEGFSKPSGRFTLAVAALGWIVPFALWIRKRKSENP